MIIFLITILTSEGILLSSRGRRSPRGRRAQPGPGSLPDTDRDRLLTDHSPTYRKYPGLNNVAYMVGSPRELLLQEGLADPTP